MGADPELWQRHDHYGHSISSCQFGCGTIFKLEPHGKLAVLHAFNGKDGDGPGALTLDKKTGTFYGITGGGGASGWGTIFQLKS